MIILDLRHERTETPAQYRQKIVTAILALTPDERAQLAARWPAGVPTLKQSAEHTVAQLDAIETELETVLVLKEFPDAEVES